MTARGDLLDEAKLAVDGDRNQAYGEPKDNFAHTAALLNAYFNDQFSFTAADVAIIMTLVKVSRLWTSPDRKDHWLDIAGYAACGWECAV